MFSLLPWKRANSIYDLTGEGLAQAGIRLLMADLDNTLCPYSVSAPDEALHAWCQQLRDHGVTLFLLSNSRKPLRPSHFASTLGISYLGHAGKPKTGGFYQTMAEQNVAPGECAMVGDQVFTDILGANLAGVRSILVRPISLSGNPGRYIRYWVEAPVRYLTRDRQWNTGKEG